MKSSYNELKQFLNENCPKSNYLYRPALYAYLIDKDSNEYYFFNFNDERGDAIIKYYHKRKHLFEFKEVSLSELEAAGAKINIEALITPMPIENLMYYSLIF